MIESHKIKLLKEVPQMSEKRVAVVGAGLGGLTAASYLSKYGFEVDVFERNSYPGGYACSFVRGRYEFEASLHELSGIGPENNRGNCFRVLDGCDVAEKVEFIPIGEVYKSVFPDFTAKIPVGWKGAEEAYVELFPSEKEGIRRLLGDIRKTYGKMGMAFDEMSLVDMLTFPLRGFDLIRTTGITAKNAIERYITDPKLKSLICNMWGYYGLPPSKLSYQLFSIAHGAYIDHGPYHIKGTSQALSNAFSDTIEEKGGRVHLNCGIKKIVVEKGKVVSVITDEGDEIAADYVMCNANPIHVCYDLIGKDHVPTSYLKAIMQGRIAVSTFNIYMGLDCSAEELGLREHEIFVNDTYDMDEQYRSMASIGKQKYWVLTNYNSADPDFSPKGTSVLVITCLVDGKAWMRIPPERYVDIKNRMAEIMLEEAEKLLPGLRDHIAVIEVSTPRTNMRFSGNPEGSILGTDYSLTGSSMFRPSNRGPLKGLYFANAWVRVGGGFETCITGGFLAFGEIWKDMEKIGGIRKYMPGIPLSALSKGV